MSNPTVSDSVQSVEPAPVLDSKGVQILPGSIVGMSDSEGRFSEHQGLVVCPHSNLEDEVYTVGVYFYREVGRHELHDHSPKRQVLRFDIWDEKFKNEDRFSQTDFLFDGDRWKQSPRVHFFMPSELVVHPRWEIKVVVERLFHNYWHHYSPLDPWPLDPKLYMCNIEHCESPSVDNAYFNVWGTVYPVPMCSQCHLQYNGKCGDEWPKLKKEFLGLDGIPLQKVESVKESTVL